MARKGMVLFLTLLLGVTLGVFWERSNSVELLPTFSKDGSSSNSSYTYINPLLFCSDQELSKLTSATAQKIEKELKTYLETQKQGGRLVDASIYFRDLDVGPWALINQDLLSAPSSLLKVPLAISIYKHAEKEPGFTEKTIAFGGGADVDQGQYFAPPERVQPGLTYSIKDLVKYMVVDSDNTALYLLSAQLTNQELLESYQMLGINPPIEGAGGYTMKVRTYASFFRILYNASYLGRSESEYLLSLLAQSEFKKGIVAGLPSNIKVAHKFGEARFTNGNTQLHDCGIVYKPYQPYLLCVMTHGTDLDAQAKNIADISRIIWDILK